MAKPLNPPGKTKRQRPDKAQLTIWLVGKGVAADKIARNATRQSKAMLRDVVGVSDAEYSAAGGTLAE